MQLAAALLCDAANVRERMISILSGGITRIRRPSYPAPLNAQLALVVELHQTEIGHRHEVGVLVQGQDGQQVATAQAAFDATGDVSPGETILVPIVVGLGGAMLPGPGPYSIEVTLDGMHHRTIPFRVMEPPEASGAA
ncbi:MAG: hypothetical protein R3249_04190 [Nitriliruptorales bacterium]|nr:hypothetical protein [Nitriliruptorales bacterium]